MRALAVVALLMQVSVAIVDAQNPPTAQGSKPIQDNSFLLEEAYNQEAAVIQHINTLFFDRTIHTWLYALTDEWPVISQRHQLSVTIPVQNSVAGQAAALGDIALNYRLQLVGNGDTRLAVTPRVTVLFPTAAAELGGGQLAFQGALASSFVARQRLVLHTNAGVTLTPHAMVNVGTREGLLDLFAGQSAVWLVHPRLNLMLEGVVTNVEEFTGVGTARTRETAVTISPGLRWAYNFPSGLQIVPGLAFPFGFRANDGQRGVFLYLSFEHEMPGLKK